ncbi:MAG: UTP--glucose-1-phosphate uridylyltransferase [Verrucomicrobiota bacterium]
MKLKKAVITAAGKGQEQIPLQTLINRQGEPCSALSVQLAELSGTGIEQVAIVISSEADESLYRSAAGAASVELEFIQQPADLIGFGHAILCARSFTKDEPFLLMVGDHIYVSDDETRTCAAQLVEVAQQKECTVSAVQPTHESQLAQFGTIGGQLVAGQNGLYEVTRVKEKPTPTYAEQELLVPGQRVAYYLCFFGMHVITPVVMDELARSAKASPGQPIGLSPALDTCIELGKYLAVQLEGRRFNLEQRYGLLKAQVATALHGPHRDELLTEIIDLLAPLRA